MLNYIQIIFFVINYILRKKPVIGGLGHGLLGYFLSYATVHRLNCLKKTTTYNHVAYYVINEILLEVFRIGFDI